MSTKKIRIVFYDCCYRKTSFKSQAEAAQAAADYGCANGYRCEAFQCARGCFLSLYKNGKGKCAVWHIRPMSADSLRDAVLSQPMTDEEFAQMRHHRQ